MVRLRHEAGSAIMTWSCGSPTHVKGIDVSSAQGLYPCSLTWWRRLRHQYHIQFGIVKASEGISYVNPYLKSSWLACTAANGTQHTGLYHFIDWQYSGTEQAEHFWQTIKPLFNPISRLVDIMLVIDVEEPNGLSSTTKPSRTVLNDFVHSLSKDLDGNQSNLTIYTNYNTWAVLLDNPKDWSTLKLWVAAMNGESGCPPAEFGGWTNWSYMQYGLSELGGVYTDLDQLRI
ncbi:MAG: hypothetical protein C7B45_02095 [Sulfobacillus acidophilus]|uniref:Glycoside hydrolase n=1 Tax=Sulfobacillus acidophilus TaxID=53633 RepID=A0A2T2WMW7_9FIRM|nr:MAG: hypothetical protein C7B45_02095 [Sulfobacillus acidophilus]